MKMLAAFRYGLIIKKMEVCPYVYMARPLIWDQLALNAAFYNHCQSQVFSVYMVCDKLNCQNKLYLWI